MLIEKKEYDRLTDKSEYLAQNRLKVHNDLSRYLNDFPTAKKCVEDTLQSQMNAIDHQFRIQPTWPGLMFWEGLSSRLPAGEVRSDEAALVVAVDALQVGLMLFRLLILTRCLSDVKWFKEWNRILPKDGGVEREIILQGCAAGIGDYVIVAACQEMQKVRVAKFRRHILTQFSASINQLYREQDILRQGSLDECRLHQLREIWQNEQSMSVYYMGVTCTDGSADRSRDAILKEFEFWKSIQWLYSTMEESVENLRCGICYTDERLTTLAESEDLTKELRQLLRFCKKEKKY